MPKVGSNNGIKANGMLCSCHNTRTYIMSQLKLLIFSLHLAYKGHELYLFGRLHMLPLVTE